MRTNRTKTAVLFAIDMAKIAITKHDPQVRPFMHSIKQGGWDESETLESAYYLLNIAGQTAKRNARSAEGYVNQVIAMMAVWGLVPHKDNDSAEVLERFAPPTDSESS